MEELFSWGTVLLLLVVGFFTGSRREQKHYQDIYRREMKLLNIPAVIEPGRDVDFGNVTKVFLVSASVVIASDYFKTFVARIKNFFGGRLTSYESLLDRARREAVLRVKEQALSRGANAIINLRIETSSIDQQGVEILAYATAVQR